MLTFKLIYHLHVQYISAYGLVDSIIFLLELQALEKFIEIH